MKKLILCFISLITFTACATTSTTDPLIAYEEVMAGTSIMVDVREESEVKVGMIKHAQWFALSKINSDPNWVNEFTAMVENKKIYLYCRSGHRAGQALAKLQEQNIPAENLGGYMTLKDILPTTQTE